MTVAPTPQVAGRSGGEPTRPKNISRRRGARIYLMIVPALIFYGVVVIYPNIAGGVYAFTDWSGQREAANFIGLGNFVELFSAPAARTALLNTIVIAVSTTVLQTVLGLALALALHSTLKSRNLLRTLFFAPALLPPVVIGVLWQYILTPGGPLNEVLESIGLGVLTQDWLGDRSIALATVIGVIIWQNAGLTMVIYLAGLQGVPSELLEAAQIDGAGRWQRLRRITVPLLMPATAIAMSLTLISSLKLFDQVFVMTGGGPGYATETLSLIMYKEAFVSGRYGYAAALAMVLAMIVFTFALLQLRGLQRYEVKA